MPGVENAVAVRAACWIQDTVESKSPDNLSIQRLAGALFWQQEYELPSKNSYSTQLIDKLTGLRIALLRISGTRL